MNYFDLHCDTLTRCVKKYQSLEENECCIDVKRLSEFENATQVFAAFMQDGLPPEQALAEFNSQYSIYKFTDFKSVNHILSVENADLLDGNIYRLQYLNECSVKILGLTWNGENCIGGGADTNIGLKPFGKSVVKECEKLGITIDVSHLSDKSFYDVIRIATKPVIATHSNSRAICNHKRNLDDNSLIEIFKMGGLVGINLCNDFVGEEDFPGNILRHIERMILLGGENSIALGTDFDGCTTVEGIKSISDMTNFYQIIAKNLGKTLTNKIFYENAKNFFDK